MRDALKNVSPPIADEQGLRAAIESICAPFGKVSRLQFLPAAHGSGLQCCCLMRLDTPGAEAALKSKFHVFNYGGDLAFFADVSEDWTGPRM